MPSSPLLARIEHYRTQASSRASCTNRQHWLWHQDWPSGYSWLYQYDNHILRECHADCLQTIGIRVLIKFLGLFTDLSGSTWDEEIIEGISFIENSVLQVPFFLMTFIRQLSPAMDHMFMDSLRWVDQTYAQKHKTDDPAQLRAMYYPNLKLYSEHAQSAKKKDPYQAMKAFAFRFGKKAAVSLGVYLLSLLPYVGRFVLPAASFYTFNKAVGLQPALLIFGSSILLPKRYLVMFLQSYFSSRTLMRELVRCSQ